MGPPTWLTSLWLLYHIACSGMLIQISKRWLNGIYMHFSTIFLHSWLPCLMFNLNFCAGRCCLTVMEQNGHPCLVTGQRARPRAVKQKEILTTLNCPRAQASLLFSLYQVSAEVTFDPRELICTKGLKGTWTKVRGDGKTSTNFHQPWESCWWYVSGPIPLW